MKRNGLLSYLALGVAFILFNVIAFVIPTDKTATFWTAYAFSAAAFAAQIPLWMIALGKSEGLKSKFLGISIIQVGLYYLIVQLIAFAVFASLQTLPVWSATVACTVILAIFTLCVIGGRAGANEIKRVEESVKAHRAFISSLQTDIELLAKSETDAKTKAKLKKLAETVRFSDPVSHGMLGELESKIIAKVEDLNSLVEKETLIEEIEALLFERNKKCKMLK